MQTVRQHTTQKHSLRRWINVDTTAVLGGRCLLDTHTCTELHDLLDFRQDNKVEKYLSFGCSWSVPFYIF